MNSHFFQLNFVAFLLIRQTCMSNVDEFPWSLFLGDSAQVQKEKEKNVVTCFALVQ